MNPNQQDQYDMNTEKQIEDTSKPAAPDIAELSASTDESSSPVQSAADHDMTDEPISHSETVKNKSHFPKKKVVIVVLAIVALGIIAGGSFFVGKRSSNRARNETSSTKQPANSQNQATQHSKATVNPDEITYLDRAKALGSLKLIDSYPSGDSQNSDSPYSEDSTQYYQIGSTKDGKDVIYIIYSAGLGAGGEYLAISDKANYTVFTKVFGTENQAFKWASNVVLDETTTIPALRAPETAEFSGQPLKLKGFGGTQQIITADNPAEEKQKKDIGTAGAWKFTRSVPTDEASYQIVSLQAKFNNLFVANYNLNGELGKNTDKVIAIKWSKGDNNQSTYDNAGKGCGNSGFMIPKNIQKTDLTEIGTTPAGQKLYQLPTTHSFVKALYDKDYNKGEYLPDDLKNLTIQQLTDKHAYILVENAFGDYVVMLRNDIFIRGGCAKPVIYLYPTQQTTVTVGVGALVTLSDPFYPTVGWRGIVARPDGTLTYQGKQYGSLFWEGYGQGAYPDVTSGTIVPTWQALETIQNQLHQQGLNQQETNDFIDFWKTKLPNKPYIRLTWFGTKDLQQLAPLYITPRPTTLIRVFLDSEGLDKPINLPLQQFTAPARNGFTVVEWGGLARDGSVPTLP